MSPKTSKKKKVEKRNKKGFGESYDSRCHNK